MTQNKTKMSNSNFVGFDLFDPSVSDEPVSLQDDLDLLPSAADFLGTSSFSRSPSNKSNGPPVRSKTSVDLRAEAKNDPIGTVRIR